MLKSWPKINVLVALVIVLCFFTSTFANAASGMLPKMTAASSVYLYDISSDGATEQIIARCLQGLINQTSASIYLEKDSRDLEQLNNSGKSYTAVSQLSGSNPGLRTLFRDHKSSIQRLIIWDPSKEWTFDIALMMAAQQNGIPVTDSIRSSIKSEFGWTGTEIDIRNNWTDRASAYNWAITNLLPGCSNKVMFAAGLRSDWQTNPYDIFDYAVATKGFTFWMDYTISAEKAVIQSICQQGNYIPGLSTVMGYDVNGDDLLNVVGNYGIGYVVSDFYRNGSFWSSFPNHTYTQDSGKAFTPQPGKIYASIVLSDGDNIQIDENDIYNVWTKDPNRGKIPVGTTLGASLQEINSPLLDWMYANKTPNDELLAGPSGFQFIYGTTYMPSAYSTWLSNNKAWTSDAGFHNVCVWNYPNNSQIYTDYIKNCGFDGIFDGWDQVGAKVLYGVGLMNQGAHLWNEGDLYNALSTIAPDPNAPKFVNVFPIVGSYMNPGFSGDGFTKLKNEIDRLNNDFPNRFQFLLPKDNIATLKEYYGRKDITSADFDTKDNPEETTFIATNSASAIDNDHRFADMSADWTYKFDLADNVTSAKVNLDIAGNYIVSGSKDGTTWTQLAEANGLPPRSIVTVDLSSLLASNTSKTVYLKFSDGTTNDGNGPCLWHLKLATASSDITSADFDTKGNIEETVNLYQNNASSIDNDHRFADMSANWTYKFDLADNVSSAKVNLDIAGNYVVSSSKDGTTWTQLAAAGGLPPRSTVSVDLSSLLASNTPKTVYLKFSDGTTNDGNGPCLWHLKLATASSDITSADFDTKGNIEETANLYQDNASRIDVDHRYADNTTSFTYKFDLADNVTSAKVSLDIAANYVVSGSKDGTTWTQLAAAGSNVPRSTIILDLGSLLTNNTSKTVYLKFSDGTTNDGWGTNLWHLKLATDMAKPDFDTKGNVEELPFLYSNCGSGVDVDHRFADMSNYWIYKFDLNDSLANATAELDIRGDYVVSGSKDGTTWTQLAASSGIAARQGKLVDISSLLVNNPTKVVYLKFSDGSPSDGAGPSLWHIKIK